MDYDNNGCNGGLMTNAFKYIKANNGIDTEDSYPYVGKEQKCKFKKKDVGATVTGFVQIAEGDERQLKEAVASEGPISVAIDASHHSFMLYSEGGCGGYVFVCVYVCVCVCVCVCVFLFLFLFLCGMCRCTCVIVSLRVCASAYVRVCVH